MYPRKRKIVEHPIYVVQVRVRPANDGDPNTEIIAAKLRRGDADELVRQVPGAWTQKIIATKP